MDKNKYKKKSYSSQKIYFKKKLENIPTFRPIIFNLKCPLCNKICLIDINKEQLSISFRCNNNICGYFNNFKYELLFSQNFQKSNYLNNSEIYCPKHPKLKFYSYCYECQKNICKQCRKEHAQHNQIGLNTKKPKDNEIFRNKIKSREKFENFNKAINNILKWKNEFENGINSFINVMKNIYILENFIIMNYDKNNYQNYNYIENYNFFKTLNYKNHIIDEFLQISDWKEKGKLLIKEIFNFLNIIDNSNPESGINQPSGNNINENNVLYSNNKNLNNNSLKKINKKEKYNIKKDKEKDNIIDLNLDTNRDSKYNYLLTIEQNDNLKKVINNSIKLNKNLIKKPRNKENAKINLNNIDIINNNIQTKPLIRNLDNNTFEEDINTNPNITGEINKEEIGITTSQNDVFNNGMIKYENENENENLTKNSKFIIDVDENEEDKKDTNNTIVFKNEKEERYMIKSIEFMNKNQLLICTQNSINVYKINSFYGIDIEYFINISNNKINYGRQLSNGNLAICFSDIINIIKIKEGEKSIIKNYSIIQKLVPKNDSFNINKIIEIKHKNYLISCDKNYITIYKKNILNELYVESDSIKINGEVKCIENINEKYFATLIPEREIITFYDVWDFKDNFLILPNIQSSYGRYSIINVLKYNCIFVAGIYGIYYISLEKLEIINFFEIGEWISCIDYDYINDYLICGSYKSNNDNDIKNYNLIIFSIEKENSENNNNLELIEKKRKNNIHQNDIMVIKFIKDGYILTGSKDKKFKIWK